MIRSGAGPATFADAVRLADAIVERIGKTIVLALPLGVGKANPIANALYTKAVADRSIRLTIFTGLTLEVPRAKNKLERRFFSRQSGAGFSAVRAAARAGRTHGLRRRTSRRHHRAGRRDIADRHRLAGRRGRAKPGPASKKADAHHRARPRLRGHRQEPPSPYVGRGRPAAQTQTQTQRERGKRTRPR